MECGALVAKAVLAGGELTEVFGSLGDDIVKKLEGDAAQRLAVDRDVELARKVAGKRGVEGGDVCSGSILTNTLDMVTEKGEGEER